MRVSNESLPLFRHALGSASAFTPERLMDAVRRPEGSRERGAVSSPSTPGQSSRVIVQHRHRLLGGTLRVGNPE
jgi:hypothetical protein